MRIVHIIDSLGAGGAESSLVELLPELAQRGIDSSIVILHRRDEGVEAHARELGLSVHPLAQPRRTQKLAALRKLLRELRPDLVHTSLYEADVLGRLATARRVPLVTSLVNTSYGPHRLSDPGVSRAKLAIAQAVDVWTARFLTTHFHSITEAVKESAVRSLRIPAERITVVPRGRDPRRLGKVTADRRRRTRQAFEIDETAWLVITAGRQEHQKGHATLLRAARLIAADYPGIRWLIAGREGNESGRLRELHATLGLGSVVRFLGHRDDVPDLMAAADLFVFPSLFEGLGGVVLEAMALELPIIASDLPPLREVLAAGDVGRLVPPSDPDALAAEVRNLLTEPGRRRDLAAKAKLRFEKHYTLDESADNMARLFASVAAHPCRGWLKRNAL